MLKRFSFVLLGFLLLLLAACEDSPRTATPSEPLQEDARPNIVDAPLLNDATDSDVKEIDSPETGEDDLIVSESQGMLSVHFIDVGSADAMLIEYTDDEEQYHILIDSGDWNSRATVDYLKQLKIPSLDIIIGTHPHADHIGQIDKIIEQFDVGEVWMSGIVSTSQVFERVIDAIALHEVGYHEPRAGEIYDIGPLIMEIVHPKTIGKNMNNGSISTKLTYGDISFLFTGDAEASAENEMIARGHNLNATILKLGHHGSNTSTTPNFLAAVSPDVGVITVGKNDRYGHPDKEVLDRVHGSGIDLYSTATDGTIIIKTDGQTYDITTMAGTTKN